MALAVEFTYGEDGIEVICEYCKYCHGNCFRFCQQDPHNDITKCDSENEVFDVGNVKGKSGVVSGY